MYAMICFLYCFVPFYEMNKLFCKKKLTAQMTQTFMVFVLGRVISRTRL